MLFEDIKEYQSKYISYKGKLNYLNRLKVMSKYDFLILPSKTEGFPLILLECMAIGLPFITTKVGAIEDFVGESYPYYCETNTSSIMKTINIVIEDFKNKKIRKIVNSNRKKLLEFYSYSSYGDRLKELIFL